MEPVRKPRGRRAALAILVAAALFTAACGDDDDTSSANAGTGTDSTKPAADVLGEAKKASGTPVKVGLVSDGKSDTIDNTPEIEAAKASTQYVNDYLGGVAGHPIDLQVCETHQTPSGATDCATKMIDAKVVAVLYGVTGQGGSLFKGLEGSNIPLIALGSIDQDTLLKPGAFAIANLLASVIAGPAGVAQAQGIKRAAVVVIDVPAASGPVTQIGSAFYKNAGVQLDIVTVPPGTADMTPNIQAELANDPGQIAIIGDSAFCTSAIKAIKTLAFTGSVVLVPECIGDDTAASIPGGYAGMTLVAWNSSSDHSTKDYALYSAVMAKFAKGSPKGGTAPGGYAVIQAFSRVMNDVTGDITPATVQSTFAKMPAPLEFPFSGGTTFQCGTAPVAITPNICAAEILTGKLDEKGNGSGFEVLDTSDLTKLA